MGPDRDRTRDPWICSQTRICSQTCYRLRYAARWLKAGFWVWIPVMPHFHRYYSLPVADSSMPVFSYWWKYVVNCLAEECDLQPFNTQSNALPTEPLCSTKRGQISHNLGWKPEWPLLYSESKGFQISLLALNTLFILIDYSIWFDIINFGWFIYRTYQGSEVRI